MLSSQRVVACLLLTAPLVSTPALAQRGHARSNLFGHVGELRDPHGRLPDYSYAGYRSGEAPLPIVPVVADVKSFGARGDGVTDDVQAFRAAIAFVASTGRPGAVRVPVGTYVIGGILELDDDGVVLRGDRSRPGGSVLYFPRSGSSLTGSNKPWIHGGGGLVHVGDRGSNNPGLGARLTSVVRDEVRGDHTLTVSSTAGLSVGDYVVLQQTESSDRSLGRHMHNDQAYPGNCKYMPQPSRRVVTIERIQGTQLVLKEPHKLDVRAKWSPALYRYEGVREVGIEHLHLACEPHSYPGHLQEAGYNPITFHGAVDSWMNDVTIEYADNGPSAYGLSKNCTFRNVVLQAGMAGHHAFSLAYSTDCLLEDFVVEPVFIHGITLDHQAAGNVIRRGFGTDLSLDHHRDASYENLFSDVHVGNGGQVWTSGGASCAGPRAGARNTYWNLQSSGWSAPPPLPTSPEWAQVQSNVVPGGYTTYSEDGLWSEALGSLRVRDLYAAQLERRLHRGPVTTARHTVATFEDGTIGALGLAEGPAPVVHSGAAWAADARLVRLVDPLRKYDDQEIVLTVAKGMPADARVGVSLRAPSRDGSLATQTALYLERPELAGAPATFLQAHLTHAGAPLAKSAALSIQPDLVDAEVRIRVVGDRVQVFADGIAALDYSGLPTPANGGFTSFFMERRASGGSLGLLHAQVLRPGHGAELHIDEAGTMWLSMFEPGMFASPNPGNFAFHYDGVRLTYPQFVKLVLPRANKVDSMGPDHLTIGFPTSALTAGTSMMLDYGARDEVVVPWW